MPVPVKISPLKTGFLFFLSRHSCHDKLWISNKPENLIGLGSIL